MKKYEYREIKEDCLGQDDEGNNIDFEKTINALALKGWRVIGYQSFYMTIGASVVSAVLMEREIPEPRKLEE